MIHEETSNTPTSTTGKSPRRRLAILGSHPIPYRVPIYKRLALRDDLEILVLYGDDYGVKPGPSAWGESQFVWKAPITEGYPHRFLRNWSFRPNPTSFGGKVNPGIPFALRKFQPDAVVISGWAGPYHLLGIASSLLLRIPIIYLAETTALARPVGLRGRIRSSVLSALYPRVSAFLALGKLSREHYQSYGVNDARIFWFPYTVDSANLLKDEEKLRADREKLRKDWGIPPGAFCVLFAGRLSEEKNAAELIRAAARVPETHVLVVGSGPEQPMLTELARDLSGGRITFAGFLNQDRLGEAYAAADLLCMPSKRETWGLVCNEAMLWGLPVVLSDQVGAGPDLVSPGVTGWTYPAGNVDELAKTLSIAAGQVSRDPGRFRDAVRSRISFFNVEEQEKAVLAALDLAMTPEKSRRQVSSSVEK